MLAQHGHGRVEIVRLYAVHDPLVLVDESWHGMNDQAEATRPVEMGSFRGHDGPSRFPSAQLE